jgi:hypothetical protein
MRKNIASIMLNQNKRNAVLTEILHVAKHSGRVAYVKVTEKSLTMSASTVLGDSRTYQLAWYLVQLTGVGNRLGLKP